jgi:hypothetical protein
LIVLIAASVPLSDWVVCLVVLVPFSMTLLLRRVSARRSRRAGDAVFVYKRLCSSLKASPMTDNDPIGE